MHSKQKLAAFESGSNVPVSDLIQELFFYIMTTPIIGRLISLVFLNVKLDKSIIIPEAQL